MKVRQLPLDKNEKEFLATVWKHYRAKGRHDLPWRKTVDPYRILVSELMLQQTQVSRVIPKYRAFLKQFPSTQKLAAAPLGDVLKAWQGLGYNRRAKFLWETAQVITGEYKGRWPMTMAGLQSLPGIGPYTAGAVMNFAYNQPVPLIETNIRTAYIHHFFHDAVAVSDKALLSIIERTLDRERPREWHSALMDYGAHLKATIGNLSRRSQAYKKQSPFKESNRYVRGLLLKELATSHYTTLQLCKKLEPIEVERIEQQLTALLKEGLIAKQGRRYMLPN